MSGDPNEKFDFEGAFEFKGASVETMTKEPKVYYELQFSVTGSEVMRKDWLSKCDPVVAVFHTDGDKQNLMVREKNGERMLERTHTEMVKNENSPSFTRKLVIDAVADRELKIAAPKYRLVVYDGNSAVLEESQATCYADIDVAAIVAEAKDNAFEVKLDLTADDIKSQRKIERHKSHLVIKGEVAVHNPFADYHYAEGTVPEAFQANTSTDDDHVQVEIGVTGSNLVSLDWLSQADPLVYVWRGTDKEGEFQPMYHDDSARAHTEMVKNDINPEFERKLLVTEKHAKAYPAYRLYVYDIDEYEIQHEKQQIGYVDLDLNQAFGENGSGETFVGLPLRSDQKKMTRRIKKLGSVLNLHIKYSNYKNLNGDSEKKTEDLNEFASFDHHAAEEDNKEDVVYAYTPITRYTEFDSVVDIRVSLSAANLVPLDWLSKADPLAWLWRASPKKEGQFVPVYSTYSQFSHTNMVKNDNDPTWERTLRIIERQDPNGKMSIPTYRIWVYDVNQYRLDHEKEQIGFVDVPLQALIAEAKKKSGKVSTEVKVQSTKNRIAKKLDKAGSLVKVDVQFDFFNFDVSE